MPTTRSQSSSSPPSCKLDSIKDMKESIDMVISAEMQPKGGDSTPYRKRTRSELMQQSSTGSPMKLQSLAKWRSPRRSTNADVMQSPTDSPVNPHSPAKWRSPRRVVNGDADVIQSPNDSPVKPHSPAKWRSPRRVVNGDADVIQSPNDSPVKPQSPAKWISPRRCTNGDASGLQKESNNNVVQSPKLLKSPRKRLLDSFPQKPKWNPRGKHASFQMHAVKEALHVSAAPCTILCREQEQKRVFEFCKDCIDHDRAGSLYVCGCPGTGKTLSIEKVKEKLEGWAREVGYPVPDVLAVNCTSLASSTEIFNKILDRLQPRKKKNGSCLPLQHLQNLSSQKKQSNGEKMMLMIIDEMDYLITKDRAVLHDLFMLTTFPYSRFILIGIANAIDLADRFLPKLQSLNCKPMVLAFRAYSKDQILKILQQRLMALTYDAFQPQALELCARKVAAASGDMRKALSICRSAIEMLEAEFKDPTSSCNLFSLDKESCGQPKDPASGFLAQQEINIVRLDHMAIALSKTFKSPVVETIQSLPQHQQIILCSAVKHFGMRRKHTTIGELNKSYSDICRTVQVPPANMLEFSNMCRVLSDQGILKLGLSREDKLKRVALKVDEADITFALQGIRFFRNCLQ